MNWVRMTYSVFKTDPSKCPRTTAQTTVTGATAGETAHQPNEETTTMSKQLTITVPDIVAAAMEAKGKPFELSGGEWLKSRLIMSIQGCDVPLGLASAVPSEPVPVAPEQLELAALSDALGGGNSP